MATGHGKDSAGDQAKGASAAESVSPRSDGDRPPIQSTLLLRLDRHFTTLYAINDAAPPRMVCRTVRNSSVTALASTLFEMSCVLMKMMISDRVLVWKCSRTRHRET